MAQTKPSVRKPMVAGQFYPEAPDVLRADVENFLANAQAAHDPKVRGLIVPHAGYMYSGAVAAEAYKTIQGRSFDTVVIIAFLHRVFLPGVLVDNADFHETPLGRVRVDQDLARAIRAAKPCLNETVKAGVIEEHSLEVQVPFLQIAVRDLKIVPIYMGEQSLENAQALAAALAKELPSRNALVVVSTDLSHFYPYEDAVQKDRNLIGMIENGNVKKIGAASQTGEAEACGLGPVISGLLLAEKMGWKKPELIRYQNSGDVTGDRRSVVGYAAMAFREA